MIGSNNITRIVFSAPAMVIMGGIFYLSHIPQPLNINIGLHFEDKIIHVFAYFVLGITLIAAIKANFIHYGRKKILWIVLLIGTLYGISDEYHQSFIPGRCAEFFDWMADIAGIILSLTMLGKISNFADRAFGNNEKTMKTTASKDKLTKPIE